MIINKTQKSVKFFNDLILFGLNELQKVPKDIDPFDKAHLYQTIMLTLPKGAGSTYASFYSAKTYFRNPIFVLPDSERVKKAKGLFPQMFPLKYWDKNFLTARQVLSRKDKEIKTIRNIQPDAVFVDDYLDLKPNHLDGIWETFSKYSGNNDKFLYFFTH